LTKYSQGLTRTTDDGTVLVSKYTDAPLDKKTYAQIDKVLQARYENYKSISFMMPDLLKKKKFTNQRLIDAVNVLIENNTYLKITPADILNYDKYLELKTNQQILEKANEFGNTIWNYYDAIDFNGTCMYVQKGKMKELGISFPLWKSKPHKPIMPPNKEESEKFVGDLGLKELAKKLETKAESSYKPKVREQYKRLTPEELVAEVRRRAKIQKLIDDEDEPL
jgi:hypothetical protein